MGEQPQCEWLSAKEVKAKYNLSKTFVYERLKDLVQVRKLPGESMKFHRGDLDRICRQFTTAPEAPAPVVAMYQQRGQPRPAVVVRPRFLELTGW